MAEEREQRPIASITGYDAAPPPPPALPVPPRKRLPRWAIALTACAVVLTLLAVGALPYMLVQAALRNPPLFEPQRAEQSEETSSAADVEDEYGGYLADDAEVVAGAKPDAAFLAALANDYPAWEFSGGRFSQQKWEKGGSRQWDLHLESKRYPGLLLELEYLQTVDEKGQPADAWETEEDFFKKGGSREAASLLDRFARDEALRPLVISATDLDEMTAGGRKDVYRVSWERTADGEYGQRDYHLEPDGRWTLLP